MQNKFLTLLIIVCTLTFTANGQKDVNSPYSRYNIGMLEPAGSFRNISMGGIETGLRDNSSVSISNPASYSAIDTTSFLFDFGIDYSMSFLSDGKTKSSSDDINFDHLIMGFPISRGFGVSLGVVPVSNNYYKLATSVEEGDSGYNPSIGEYTNYHGGTGSYYSFFLGTGLKITKNFSAGVNMKVLTGELKRVNQLDFADSYNVYHDNSTEKLSLNGINFDYGIQYMATLKNNYFFNAGVSMASSHNYKSNYELLAVRYTTSGSNDTINYNSSQADAFIPATIRAGISFGKKNKFLAGFDYIDTKWSESKIPGSAGYAANTRSYLAGFEFIPDKFSNYSFLKRLEYRAGAHLADNYVIINGEQVKEYGVSAGIGIPMRRTLTKTNIFFDFTRRTGSSAQNLHTENYFTFGISLNLYDPYWFIKRKYD